VKYILLKKCFGKPEKNFTFIATYFTLTRKYHTIVLKKEVKRISFNLKNTCPEYLKNKNDSR
jgi:hypothetical protein